MVTPILPLRISEAVVRKRGKRLLGPVTHVVEQSGFTIIMGPNGSGKTTFLRLMHGLERPRQGSVVWNIDERDTRKHQAFVFQSPIIMRRTVLQNLAYPLLVGRHDKKQAREQALEWIGKIGLVADRNAKVLSGGERQKLAIARALIVRPEILFLDEPTTNLDGRSTREIEDLLREAFQSGTRIIMTTHDIGQAQRLADDVLFLNRGLICERASANDFFNATASDEAKAFLRGDIVE